MKKRINEIAQVAHGVGLRVCEVVTRGNNHLRVALETTDGRTLNYFTAATPGDHRGLLNMRSDFRRFARGGAI